MATCGFYGKKNSYEKEVLMWNRKLFAENCINDLPSMEPDWLLRSLLLWIPLQ